MRWVLLALCACNQVYGLDKQLADRDGGVYDIMPDAQPLCPAIGSLPRFSPNIHQLIDRNCGSYTTSASARRALAVCDVGIAEGPIDVHDVPQLEVAPQFPIQTPKLTIYRASLSPDGQTAYITVYDTMVSKTIYETWSRVGTSWMRGPDLPPTTSGSISTVSSAPRRFLFLNNSSIVTEYVETVPATWQPRPFNLPSDEQAEAAWLSADGLRAIIYARPMGATNSHMLYIDRTTADDAFSAPIELPSLPPVKDLFITEDCTRAYMSSVAAIFYAAQI